MLFRDGTYDLGIRNGRGQVDIPRMREGGITAVFFSVYTSATRNSELQAVQEALEIIDSIRRAVERFPEDLALAHLGRRHRSGARSRADRDPARHRGRPHDQFLARGAADAVRARRAVSHADPL